MVQLLYTLILTSAQLSYDEHWLASLAFTTTLADYEVLRVFGSVIVLSQKCLWLHPL